MTNEEIKKTADYIRRNLPPEVTQEGKEGLLWRKKPVVIEAFKWDGDMQGSDGKYYVPDWAVTCLENGVLFFEGQGELFVKTLEGNHHATVGDYIIQGVKGEIYPCKPDIFEMTYEPARPDTQPSNPVPMLLYCPNCFEQHVDEAKPDVCMTCGYSQATHETDDFKQNAECVRFDPWLNPPHKSHRCNFCNHVWRPADVPTEGVQTLTSKGERDGSPRPVAFANGKDFNDAVAIAQPSNAADLVEAARAFAEKNFGKVELNPVSLQQRMHEMMASFAASVAPACDEAKSATEIVALLWQMFNAREIRFERTELRDKLNRHIQTYRPEGGNDGK